MFTVAHELAHLWLGTSSLDDLSPTSHLPDVERWCNKVAAELLVPLPAFKEQVKRGQPLREEANRLAKTFKVSTLVVLRRMGEAGFINRTQMQQAYDEEQARLAEMPTSSGGNFYATQAARVGKRFGRAVVIDTLEGNTLHRDAFRLLGVNMDTFDRFGQQVGAVG
jgi:Zn-dependent peptidase ImmA (M78 family)